MNVPPTVEEAVTKNVPVDVAPVKSIAVKWEVEEAKMPLCAQRAEVVAAAMTP